MAAAKPAVSQQFVTVWKHVSH